MLRSLFLVAVSLLLATSASAQRVPPTPPNNGTMRMTRLADAPFTPRQEAGSAVWSQPATFALPNGGSVTYDAGFLVSVAGEKLNDVWVTSDGSKWDMVSGRMGSVNSAMPNNGLWDESRTADCSDGSNIYLIGGHRSNVLSSNVSRTSNIVQWEQLANRTFYPRQRSTCAVNRAGDVYVFGGTTLLPTSTSSSGSTSNDMWYSTTRGTSWQQISYEPTYTRGAKWQVRAGQNSEFVMTPMGIEVLYIANGFNGNAHYNDIWVSTDNARTFNRLNPAAEYWDRMDARLSVLSNGVMVVSSGEYRGDANLNDVWASLDGGYSWGQCCNGAGCGFEVREDHVTEFTKSGHLLLWSGSRQNAGISGNVDANDVWRSDISFSNVAAVEKACNLKAPPAGVGLRCLPNGYCPQHPFFGTKGVGLQMQRQADAPWTPRFEGGMAMWPKTLSFKTVEGDSKSIANPLIMYGGRINYGTTDASLINDVWALDTSNRAWYLISGTTPQGVAAARTDKPIQDQGRTADCSDSTGRMYTIGGTYNGAANSRVMMSADGGLTWTPQTDNAPFPAREAAACATGSKGEVWMMGGNTVGGGDDGYFRDVWQSTDYGKKWQRKTETAPWSSRTQADADVLPASAALDGKDILYFANGYNEVGWPAGRTNDVWVSSNGGQNWVAVTLTPPYRGRQDGQLIVTPSGALLLVAGDMGINLPSNANDVWASLNGGYTWGLCNLTAGFTPREDHVAVLDKQQYLWVIQGEAPDNPTTGNGVPRNDVWRSTVPLSDANIVSLCNLKKPSCGTGLKCWPTNNSCKKNNYCPVINPDDDEDYSSTGTDNTDGGSGGLSATWIALIVLVVAAVVGGFFYFYYKRFVAPGSATSGGKDSELLGAPLNTGSTDSNGQYHHMDIGRGNTNGTQL